MIIHKMFEPNPGIIFKKELDLYEHDDLRVLEFKNQSSDQDMFSWTIFYSDRSTWNDYRNYTWKCCEYEEDYLLIEIF